MNGARLELAGGVSPKFRGRGASVFLLLLVAVLGLFQFHALKGIDADLGALARIVAHGPLDTPRDLLLYHLRLPRSLAALLAGSGLAVAGALFQAATRNPLASPGILGVTAGAQLALAIAATFSLSVFFSPFAIALAGGTITGMLTWLVSGGTGAGPVRIALSGMAVSLMAGAAGGALALVNEKNAAGLYLWGGGSLVQADWNGVFLAAAGLAAACPVVFLMFRPLDILALGDDAARALGQNLALVRTTALLLGVWMAALAVTVVGPVVFIGLIAPNMLRFVGVTRSRTLLPASALVGACLLLAADTVILLFAGTLFELPVSVPTAIIGAPVLILLARRFAFAEGNPAGVFARRSSRPSGQSLLFWRVIVPVILLLLAMAAGMMAGTRWTSPGELIDAVLAWLEGAAWPIILEARFTRVASAALAGGLLGLSGLLFQGVIRNPLAGPELLGITQCAGLAAVVMILSFPSAGSAGVQAGAFIGGLAAVGILRLLGAGGKPTPMVLALMAIGITALTASLSAALVAGAGFQASRVATWLAGSTYGASASDALLLAAGLAVIIPVSALILRWADLLSFGPLKAASLGLHVGRTETLLLMTGAMCASLVASVFGPISFIGLMAPNAARALCPGQHRQLLLPSACIGATLLVTADLLGRSLFAPVEIPSGLMTALIGTPFILLLLRRL